MTSDNNMSDNDDSHLNHTNVHHHSQMFQPLSCNHNIMEEPCTLWSEYFGTTETTFEQTATIPCGVCIRLEEHFDVTFEGGLDVVGRLLIVPSFSGDISIHTTSIIVQGVLSIYSFAHRIPQSHSKLHIELFNTNGDEIHFIPHDENKDICNPCNAGKMPIAVAGGRLDIHAMPTSGNDGQEECPTWTDLIQVATGGPPTLIEEDQDEVPIFPCGSDNEQVLIAPNDGDDWSHWDTTDSVSTLSVDPDDISLVITGRTKSTQGPRVQIYPPPNGDPCLLLSPGVPYLLSAKIKITPSEGITSTCQTKGKCLYLQLQRIGRYNKSTLRTIDFSRHDAPTLDGEYFTYSAVI
eukprot:CAMPEP_0195303880 /NCGR_PEP_ID=MMETSP0707-20130614/33501_1 /TAXON_ID=33640 /ORGANISM="Asterionellopsis glacialis, Strain CCMP134" /LENGTH=349 /DNA_ID=CAMNT_0040367547 /DNA_START=211 /DNA_END=1257 /DNA_ORIENTATION=+